MISRKVATSILAILAVGVLVYALNCEVAEAQTAPTWIATGITTGKTAVADTGNTTRTLSSVQFVESASWVGSIWGQNYDDSWIRIAPMNGSNSADTTLSIDGTSPYFEFNSIKASVFVTVSGTATLWGE